MILGDVTRIEMGSKSFLDGGSNGVIGGLFLEAKAAALGQWWIRNLRGGHPWRYARGHPWKLCWGLSWEHGNEFGEGFVGGVSFGKGR